MKIKISLSGENPLNFSKKEFKGVGMIRSEYLLKKYNKYIAEKEMQDILSDYVKLSAEHFEPHDVWYRTIELPTNWINKLEGVDYIVNEKTPMEGLRGIRRGLKYPKIFKMELKLISELCDIYSNIQILFPFVYDIEELKEVKRFLKEVDYKNKIGIMAEIPSTIICLDEFCEEGLDNITVGLNDLTEFTLGCARELDIYDRNHSAVRRMVSRVRSVGKDYPIETVLSGKIDEQMFNYAQLLEFDAISLFSKDIKLLDKLKDT